MATFLLLLLAFAGWNPPGAHPDSRSTSMVKVAGRRVSMELRCQTRTLGEALALDSDQDQRIDDSELEAGRDALAAYVLERYQIFPGGSEGRDGNFEASHALRGHPTQLRLIPDSESAQGESWVAAQYEFESPVDLESLTLRVRLFREQNPYHRDEARLEFQGDEPARHLFSGEEGQVWRYEPEAERRPGVFGDYWKEGVKHIAAGWDHLAFLLGLLLAARRWRSVMLVVTAFTLAHTITLALAALELVHVRASLVEMAIALSIAYVGALNLLPRQTGSRWVEAFFFGLVHGLGFAGAIKDALVFEPLRITALIGFNAGVECGQLAIVMPLAAVFAFLPGSRQAGEVERAFLAPLWLRRAGSVLVVAAGLYWFAQRSGIFHWFAPRT
ncbi:MAG: HupE/UreJ family protein [Planctomycetota bacterium]